jgi:hypothetical protein
MANAKRLHFETYEEAAEWFDTHDMTEYADQLTPVEFHGDLRKNRHWVELDDELARQLRQLAQRQHVSTRTLVNTFLKERLQHV